MAYEINKQNFSNIIISIKNIIVYTDEVDYILNSLEKLFNKNIEHYFNKLKTYEALNNALYDRHRLFSSLLDLKSECIGYETGYTPIYKSGYKHDQLGYSKFNHINLIHLKNGNKPKDYYYLISLLEYEMAFMRISNKYKSILKNFPSLLFESNVSVQTIIQQNHNLQNSIQQNYNFGMYKFDNTISIDTIYDILFESKKSYLTVIKDNVYNFLYNSFKKTVNAYHNNIV